MVPPNLFLCLIVLYHEVNLRVRNEKESVRVHKQEVGARHNQILIGQVQPIHPTHCVRFIEANVDHLKAAAEADYLKLG